MRQRTGSTHLKDMKGRSLTVHDDQIVHGVAKMESGVRYGLFLL